MYLSVSLPTTSVYTVMAICLIFFSKWRELNNKSCRKSTCDISVSSFITSISSPSNPAARRKLTNRSTCVTEKKTSRYSCLHKFLNTCYENVWSGTLSSWRFCTFVLRKFVIFTLLLHVRFFFVITIKISPEFCLLFFSFYDVDVTSSQTSGTFFEK